jgi:hypothetical protein
MSATLWHYKDARGVSHIGTMEKYIDLSGSDHIAVMRDHETNEMSLLSGSRLQAMTRCTPQS